MILQTNTVSIVIETVTQLKNVGPLNFVATIVTREDTLRIVVNLKMGHGYPITQELKPVDTTNPSNNVKDRKGTLIRVGRFLLLTQ
jgi:hypothetical protein